MRRSMSINKNGQIELSWMGLPWNQMPSITIIILHLRYSNTQPESRRQTAAQTSRCRRLTAPRKGCIRKSWGKSSYRVQIKMLKMKKAHSPRLLLKCYLSLITTKCSKTWYHRAPVSQAVPALQPWQRTAKSQQHLAKEPHWIRSTS